jgi:hypothetical protein
MSRRKQQRRADEQRAKRPLITPRFVTVVVLIVVAGGALATLMVSMSDRERPVSPAATPPGAVTPEPWQYDPITNRHWHAEHGHWHAGRPPAGATSGALVGGDGVAGPPGITNPTPWQYDAATNRHYDPGHQHWHSGPPPADIDKSALVSPVGSDRVPAPPGIVNPTPWQYDPGTDRHYHPGHQHWHSGPPPADR